MTDKPFDIMAAIEKLRAQDPNGITVSGDAAIVERLDALSKQYGGAVEHRISPSALIPVHSQRFIIEFSGDPISDNKPDQERPDVPRL